MTSFKLRWRQSRKYRVIRKFIGWFGKKKADTEKSIVLTRKTQLQTDKLNREMGGSEIPLSDIYDEILAMDNDGMMNH
jgi:hypothetical protein